MSLFVTDDPLSEKTAAWLDGLDPDARYAAMLAMNLVFPWLPQDPDWRVRADAVRRQLGE